MSTVSVSVVRVAANQRAQWLSAACAVLSPAERQYLPAIPDPEHRAQHAVGRALLRVSGAQLSGRDPRQLEITVSDLGKPLLPEWPHLHVSVAHTGGVVVVAGCDGAAVGVDIEPAVPTVADPRRLAERLFAEVELVHARRLDDEAFNDWFSSAWTVKEAVGKALGAGMVPAFTGAVLTAGEHNLDLASVWSGPPADRWTVHRPPAPNGDEKLAVAVAAPAVALEPVLQLGLPQFAALLQKWSCGSDHLHHDACPARAGGGGGA